MSAGIGCVAATARQGAAVVEDLEAKVLGYHAQQKRRESHRAFRMFAGVRVLGLQLGDAVFEFELLSLQPKYLQIVGTWPGQGLCDFALKKLMLLGKL